MANPLKMIFNLLSHVQIFEHNQQNDNYITTMPPTWFAVRCASVSAILMWL